MQVTSADVLEVSHSSEATVYILNNNTVAVLPHDDLCLIAKLVATVGIQRANPQLPYLLGVHENGYLMTQLKVTYNIPSWATKRDSFMYDDVGSYAYMRDAIVDVGHMVGIKIPYTAWDLNTGNWGHCSVGWIPFDPLYSEDIIFKLPIEEVKNNLLAIALQEVRHA